MSMEIILLVVLIALVAALFVFNFLKRKKFNSELKTLREELKPGDKVMTDSGVVGEVVESYVEDEYTYFVLKSGKGSNVGYYTVHGNAIYYVFGKEEKKDDKKVVVKVAPKATVKADETKPSDDAKSDETK